MSGSSSTSRITGLASLICVCSSPSGLAFLPALHNGAFDFLQRFELFALRTLGFLQRIELFAQGALGVLPPLELLAQGALGFLARLKLVAHLAGAFLLARALVQLPIEQPGERMQRAC